MAVIINDMEHIPKSCYDCDFHNYHFCDMTGNCVEQNIDDNTRADDCPLKEVNDKPSGVTTKQLEAMYESYEKSLWREREDIRGDDMVLLSDAMAFLQEELCMLGCWDDEEQGEAE